jgi:hypothetical protein
VKRGAARRPNRRRPRSEGRQVRAVEEPREPHRPPALNARRHPEHQPPALPRLPAQGAAQADLPASASRCDHPLGRLAEVGQAMSPPAPRQALTHDHRPARRHPCGDPARPLKRPRRGHQHSDPADHATRVRLPLPRRADRAGDAHPRRPLPAAPTVNHHSHDPRKRQETPFSLPHTVSSWAGRCAIAADVSAQAGRAARPTRAPGWRVKARPTTRVTPRGDTSVPRRRASDGA